MSAFIVGKEHIDAMVAAAWLNDRCSWKSGDDWAKVDDLSADNVGRMLLCECIASVKYRYHDEPVEDLPGSMEPIYPAEYAFPVTTARRLSPIEAIKATHCYEYQSCEHPGWEESEAKRFCGALINSQITRLSGYPEAAWEVKA